jgi:hypothetical protein
MPGSSAIEFACRCDVGDEKVERHAVQGINMPATETQPVIALVTAFETGKPIGRNKVAIATVLVEGQSVIEIARFAQNLLKLEFEFEFDPGQPTIITATICMWMKPVA